MEPESSNPTNYSRILANLLTIHNETDGDIFPKRCITAEVPWRQRLAVTAGLHE